MTKLIEPVTGVGNRFLETTGKLTSLFFATIYQIVKGPKRIKLTIEQMEIIGVQSLPIALLTATFTGMVLVLQTGVQLERFGGKLYAVGIAAIALTREIGPVLTSVVLAGRVGAGITAEIGTMKVTEQIDALRTLATDPINYLVAPRFIAGIIMLPLVTVLADWVGILGGVLTAKLSLGISVTQSINTAFDWLALRDFFSGIMKTSVFGGIIAIVGCYNGFETSGGAEGVGQSTTRSVVMASILILISNYFLTEWILKIFEQ